MKSDNRTSLALVRRFNVPRAAVYAAWTQPALLARWLAPGAGQIVSTIADVSPGGRYALEGEDTDGRPYAIRGHYLEISAPARLVMSWHYEGASVSLRGAPSKLTVELRALSAEVTELVLTHEQLNDTEQAEFYRTIWTLCLGRLDAATRTGGPDEQALRFPGGAMSDLYGPAHRRYQAQFDTDRLASRLRNLTVSHVVKPEHREFIASRNMFFLTSIDHRGYPTCSYKGGTPGFVQVLDERTIAFPVFNGNGMYLSMGNIDEHPKVGLLFIDFVSPHRLRLHGTASVVKDESALQTMPGAELLVHVAVTEVFVNCARYVHRYQLIESSPFVPAPGRKTILPDWKRLDAFRDALPARERLELDKGVKPGRSK
jgi:uncharacterized protein YndB with AHSA1/START domain/predicted pyridoxine 5'-phosphate oxidase superfamily flavin-nucleotide-binding protein